MTARHVLTFLLLSLPIEARGDQYSASIKTAGSTFGATASQRKSEGGRTFVCAHPGITDGDTIRCGSGERVRIWGIQAPERSDPGGPASTRALAHIIAGHDLTCQRKGQSYNRTVAICYRGGHDIAAEMVRQGQAVDWPKYSRGFYGRVR